MLNTPQFMVVDKTEEDNEGNIQVIGLQKVWLPCKHITLDVTEGFCFKCREIQDQERRALRSSSRFEQVGRWGRR